MHYIVLVELADPRFPVVVEDQDGRYHGGVGGVKHCRSEGNFQWAQLVGSVFVSSV